MLPSVESPIPETIGLGTIFSLAGSFAMLGFFLATLLKRSSSERDQWSGCGIALGLLLGAVFYLIALINELL
jgi:hypothetical protein